MSALFHEPRFVNPNYEEMALIKVARTATLPLKVDTFFILRFVFVSAI